MWWDMCSLIQFDFSLIQFDLMTTTWYQWRHRCERWLRKISQMVVHTRFRLWYYLCHIWLCSDLLSFSLLRDHIGHWHRHDRIVFIQDNKAIYIKSMGYCLCDMTGYLTIHPFHPKTPSTAPAPQSVPWWTTPFAMTTLRDPSGRLVQNELTTRTEWSQAWLQQYWQCAPCPHCQSSASCVVHYRPRSHRPGEFQSWVRMTSCPGTVEWPVQSDLAPAAQSLTLTQPVGVAGFVWLHLWNELQSG